MSFEYHKFSREEGKKATEACNQALLVSLVKSSPKLYFTNRVTRVICNFVIVVHPFKVATRKLKSLLEDHPNERV